MTLLSWESYGQSVRLSIHGKVELTSLSEVPLTCSSLRSMAPRVEASILRGGPLEVTGSRGLDLRSVLSHSQIHSSVGYQGTWEMLWKRFYWRQQVIGVLRLEAIFFPWLLHLYFFSASWPLCQEQLSSIACSSANNLPQSHWSWVTVDWQLALQLIISLSEWPSHAEAEWPWTDISESMSQNKPRYFATAMEGCWEVYWYLMVICFSI